jgi:hypothetical protein
MLALAVVTVITLLRAKEQAQSLSTDAETPIQIGVNWRTGPFLWGDKIR